MDQDNLMIQEMAEELKLIENSKFAKIIPEVGSNLAYAKSDAKDFADVAAIPGRIRNASGRPVFLQPEFGASSHVASLLLGIMKYEKEKRCALNIKYSPEIINILKGFGMDVVFIDRMFEPERSQKEDGKSIPWVIENVFSAHKAIPDVIYHKGAIGKEAMVQLIGRNPEEVVSFALRIVKSL